MTDKHTSVMAIFKDRTTVSHAVDYLKAKGFSNSDVAVLLADNQGTKDFAHQKDTKAPEAASAGAATGALIGGTLGWLAGVGVIAIPGVGPFIAAGPILAAIAGMGAGGALGGVGGALIGLGIPEYEAKRYEGMIKEGRALMSVHCRTKDTVKLAKEYLEACGGTDIASRTETTPSRMDEAETSMMRDHVKTSAVHPMPQVNEALNTEIRRDL